jgi:hypothetical protein
MNASKQRMDIRWRERTHRHAGFCGENAQNSTRKEEFHATDLDLLCIRAPINLGYTHGL